jgi:hypothetical protein
MFSRSRFFKQHPSVVGLPKLPEARDTFTFRYAICGYAWVLKRIEDGGAGKTKPEKLRNDVIDVNFAAYATYFDGLLTADKRAAEIYAERRLSSPRSICCATGVAGMASTAQMAFVIASRSLRASFPPGVP